MWCANNKMLSENFFCKISEDFVGLLMISGMIKRKNSFADKLVNKSTDLAKVSRSKTLYFYTKNERDN